MLVKAIYISQLLMNYNNIL